MNDFRRNSRRVANMLRHSDYPNYNAWVRNDVVCEHLQLTMSELEQIVVKDDRGRFEFSEDGLMVRALYGHSIDVDLGLEPVNPPAMLYHGTAEKYIEVISREGLKPRKRKYVHLTESIEEATSVGTRHGSPVLLGVSAEAMVRDGGEFYKTRNGIWLAQEIPVRYITVIEQGNL